jgi:CHAT domain-containing protein
MARGKGQWTVAAAELEAARTAARQVGLDEWEQRLTYDMAALALDSGDLDAAESGFVGYLSRLTTEERGRGYPARARLAEIHARRGDLSRASKELIAATDELDAWRAALDASEIRLLAFQRTDDPVDPDLGIATILSALALGGEVDVSFALAERRRARELRDRLVRHEAARQGPSRAPPHIDSGAAPPARVTASDVSLALPDHRTALVSYVAGRRGEPTTAFVITRSGVQVIPLTPVDSLTAVVSRFVGLLEAGGPVEHPARELGRAVLDPIERALPDTVTRLIIVPDDVLHRVPFDALRLAEGGYALERFTIATATSAAVAMALWNRPVRGGPVRLLAFGDPRFAAPEDPEAVLPVRTALERRGGLARLAASRGEARTAARFATEGTVRLGADATERFLKASPLHGYHVLHFATHALVDDRSLTSTALALAPGEGDDGFVSSADIAALPLRAELVVLSACRTAGGVLIGGEGVHGLASAFIGAGARAVAATTWQVEDERAARLVGDYYRALAGGAPLGEALREAKLAALRRGAPVREWAAWTLIGDPLAIVPLRERKGGGVWWWGAGALLLASVYGSLTVKFTKRDARSAPSG